MIRRIVASIALLASLALALLAGCAKKKILAVENLPPETIMFVQDTVNGHPVAVDTVNHVVHLFWFGTDPDGQIVGYEVRLIDPAGPPDPPWVFTPSTDTVLTVSAPTGFARSMFEVRAIDDSGDLPPANCGKVVIVRERVGAPPESTFECVPGTRDGQAARQDFKFSNLPPTVRFTQRLQPTDTTYASVTLAWTANDPDGDAKAMRFQVGLDTLPSALRLVSGASVTIDTTDFKVGDLYPATMPRMAFIRAIDDGGRISGWDCVRWVVRAPSAPGVHPRLLLIDDVPSTHPGNAAFDALYSNAAQANLEAGSYSFLRLERTQPFRSAKDVAQTCRLFDAVIWYRGNREGFSSLMRSYQDGLSAYLDGGGKLILESLNLVEGEGATGALRESWVTDYLGSGALILSPIPDRFDSTVAWSIRQGASLYSTVYQDVLRNNIEVNGLRGFAVRDTGFVALWARDSTLATPVDRDIPVAVTVPVPERPAGAGRVIVFTLPIAGANGLGSAPRFLCKVFRQMGLAANCP